MGWIWLQEAREDRLRRSEESLAAWGLNGPTAGVTVSALIDTKDARILSLEQEVALLETELVRVRETAATVGGCLGTSPRWGSRGSLVTPPPGLPATDDTRILQMIQERERKAKTQVSVSCSNKTQCRRPS